ncbi:MAG: DegV family protein [Actinobacteria bacterium]|jgi:DegV family protein with EDD domain|nr:DegV family protein [Actinomycetota bacterium]
MIKIITDSACDIPDDMLAAGEIEMVPLTVRFGEHEFKDRVELPTSEFWKMLAATGLMPQTSAPSPGDFQKAFDDAFANGASGILCITISSGLSATYQSALTAAQAYPQSTPVVVVDTAMASMGEGLIVLKAMDLLPEDITLDEMRTKLLKARSDILLYAVIDSLDFLRQGGRIGGASALLGSMLSIKPIITMRNGKIEPDSKQRTRARALEYIAEKIRGQQIAKLAIVSGNSGDVDMLVSKLKEIQPEITPMVTDLSAIVGSHSGPGTLGICVEVDHDARNT